MLNSEIQTNVLCKLEKITSNGKQKKQNYGFKNYSVILCYINVASTAMLLCLLKIQVLLCDLAGKRQTKSLPMSHLEEQNWKEKGHKILFKGKRVWILTVSYKLNCITDSRNVNINRSDYICTIMTLLWPCCLDVYPPIYQNHTGFFVLKRSI